MPAAGAIDRLGGGAADGLWHAVGVDSDSGRPVEEYLLLAFGPSAFGPSAAASDGTGGGAAAAGGRCVVAGCVQYWNPYWLLITGVFSKTIPLSTKLQPNKKLS